MRSRSPRGSRLREYEQATGRPLTALSLLVVPVYIGQALTATGGGRAGTLFVAVRVAIHALLAVDIATRTALAPHRRQFLWSHKLDVAAVFVPPLRAAREVLALRTILRRPGLIGFAAFGASVTVGCALVVYAAEHGRESASIETVGDALWWATVTTTTVGYGDEVPITGQGRAMAVILMLLGLAVVSVVTAHIAAYFVSDQQSGLSRDSDLAVRLDRIEQCVAAIQAHVCGADGSPLGSNPSDPAPSEMPSRRDSPPPYS